MIATEDGKGCKVVNNPKCMGESFSSQLTCYKCQQCDIGYTPNKERDECVPDEHSHGEGTKTYSTCGCLQRVTDNGGCASCPAF